MKKPLLLGLSVALGISMSAQGNFRKAPANANVKKVKTFVTMADMEKEVQLPKTINNLIPSVNNTAKVTAPPYKKISSSYNVLTALVSQSNSLNYDKTLGAVSFVHRQSPNFGNVGANSGKTQIDWTLNNGTTWDSLVFGINTGSNGFRYPQGGIYNPSGNTNIANAFAVGMGPITTGSGWVGNFYVSGQLNNTNLVADEYINASTPPLVHHFARLDFNVAGSVVKSMGQLYADPSGTTWAALGYRGAAIATGTFTGTDFTWSFDTMNILAYAQNDVTANEPYLSTQHDMAWSDDGLTGYYIFYGVDVSSTLPGARSYQPIVFKTTNGGATWGQYLPGYDFSQLQGFWPYVFSYDGVNIKPFFSQGNGTDYCVDKNGDLHILAHILSGSSDDQDSLAYAYTVAPASGMYNYFFDVCTYMGGWDAFIVDSIAANASNGEASVVWNDAGSPYDNDARLQLSKSENGQKVFYVWVDTDWSGAGLADPVNVQPYIRAKGYDVDTRCITATKDYFASSDYAYYHYVSQDAMGNAGTYNIPVTYVLSADQSYNAIAQVDHYYVDDVMFTDAEFTNCYLGANQVEAMLSNVSVFPNPASHSATIAVKVKETGDIKLNIFNALGQIVVSQKVKAEAGVHKFNIAAENLASGVYFYEIKAGDFSVTDKMMIQK